MYRVISTSISISLTSYSAALAVLAAELAYGAWLINNPSHQLKARGYEVIYSAIESCVFGTLLALFLTLAPSILPLFGVEAMTLEEATTIYSLARERYVAYVVDLANVARDLTLVGFLAPLAVTWHAASGLANIFSSYLIALSTAFAVASSFCSLFGPPLLSLGIVLSGVSKVRRLGVTLTISLVSLEVFAGAVAPYFRDNALSLKFKYQGIPLSGIAQYFAGAVGEVVEDSKRMGELASWVSVWVGVAAIASAGASVAAGGFLDSLISRLR